MTQQRSLGRPTAFDRPTAILWRLACIVAVAIMPFGCSKDPEPSTPGHLGHGAHQLIVAVHAGPTSWFTGPHGDPAGFDHDLLARFAAERNLKLHTVEVNSATELVAKVAAGEAHLGVGGLYEPAPSGSGNIAADDARVLWTQGHFAVEPVVIYNVDGFKPKQWQDLQGATLAYAESTGIDAQFAAIRADHPEVTWTPLTVPSVDALIALVADGAVNYAVVPSIDAAAARNIHLDFDVAFVAGGKRDLAWAVAPSRTALRDELDAFFARARRDGLLARLADRYFDYARQVARIDAGVFQERLKTLLPQYRTLLQDAQAATGIEWRLLAAVAYQESQWNPVATSETGVRGIMQITEETAR
ncbi:MAG: transglycosylase SLT domain-containing protein, partial [Casimicrobiaceae bacterium]